MLTVTITPVNKKSIQVFKDNLLLLAPFIVLNNKLGFAPVSEILIVIFENDGDPFLV
jgi:hypothetical protein